MAFSPNDKDYRDSYRMPSPGSYADAETPEGKAETTALIMQLQRETNPVAVAALQERANAGSALAKEALRYLDL